VKPAILWHHCYLFTKDYAKRSFNLPNESDAGELESGFDNWIAPCLEGSQIRPRESIAVRVRADPGTDAVPHLYHCRSTQWWSVVLVDWHCSNSTNNKCQCCVSFGVKSSFPWIDPTLKNSTFKQSQSASVPSVALLCTRRWCFSKVLDRLKLLLHSEQSYGFSPVCTLVCDRKSPDWLKVFSHTWHLYGFSPVWILMWTFRSLDWLNALSHMQQLCNFSPVCTLMWSFSLGVSLKVLLHTKHSYGLSPVWTFWCFLKFPRWLNALSHTWHLYGFSPLCVRLCVTSNSDVVNRLLQRVHSNGFSPEWVRWCWAKCWPLKQHFPHSMHMYLPRWTFICWLMALRDVKYLSHCLHEYRPTTRPATAESWYKTQQLYCDTSCQLICNSKSSTYR